MNTRPIHNDSGFTLVEILIVVVILGILAAIVVPQFTNAANDARTANIATQVTTIESQLDLWAARNNGVYPDLVSSGETFEDLIDEGYFKDEPVNPYTGSSSIVVNTTFDDADVSIIEFSSPDSTDGWVYDQTSGNIAAIVP